MEKRGKIIISSIAGVSLIALSIIISSAIIKGISNNSTESNTTDIDVVSNNDGQSSDKSDTQSPQPSTPTPTPTPSVDPKPEPEPEPEIEPVTPEDPGDKEDEQGGDEGDSTEEPTEKYKDAGIYTLEKFFSMEELKNFGYINYYADGKLTCSPSKLNELDSFVFKIPEGIILIDTNAFKNCTKISKVIFPSTLTTIYSSAFYGCKNLFEANLSENITRIDDGAFDYCESLRSINVPKNYTNFNFEAFRFLNSIETITVEEGHQKYDSRNNCNAIIESGTNTLAYGCKNTTYPSDVDKIGNRAFYSCKGNFNFVLPNQINSIGEEAFMASGVQNVEINRNDVSFGKNVFYECFSLTKASIPDTWEYLPYGLFNRCTNLAECNLPSKVVEYGDYVFNNCEKLFNFEFLIPNTVKTIGIGAFSKTRITKLKFHDSYGPRKYGVKVETIRNEAFKDCTNIEGGVYLSDVLLEIGINAFYNCPKISEFLVYEAVKGIGSGAFGNSSSVEIRYTGSKEQFNKIKNNPYTNDERVKCLLF